jgi:hypothetical protein
MLSVKECLVEIDKQRIDTGEVSVNCNTDYRIEIKLLDANQTPLPPGNFSYNWRFVPGDPDNKNMTSSGNYALFYHAPCELNGQTMNIEVKKDEHTLWVKSITFKITKQSE